VIIVTHDSRVFDVGDNIIHMSDGKVDRTELNVSRFSNPGNVE
jgi:ABC-type lipoprotein export system ATPase subunit